MDAELAEQLNAARHLLRWAGFLLGAMIVILFIDLQLKRSIGRQAVDIAFLASEARSGFRGQAPVAAADADAGDGGSGGVERDAGLAARPRQGSRAHRSAAGGGVDGTADRAPGDDR